MQSRNDVEITRSMEDFLFNPGGMPFLNCGFVHTHDHHVKKVFVSDEFSYSSTTGIKKWQ